MGGTLTPNATSLFLFSILSPTLWLVRLDGAFVAKWVRQLQLKGVNSLAVAGRGTVCVTCERCMCVYVGGYTCTCICVYMGGTVTMNY